MNREKIKYGVKTTGQMIFLSIVFNLLMIVTAASLSLAWRYMLWVTGVCCVIYIIITGIWLLTSSGAQDNGWYSGSLFSVCALDIMICILIGMPEQEWKIQICAGTLLVSAFIGAVFCIERWKRDSNRRQASTLTRIMTALFGVLFLIVVFVGKIYRGAAGGRLLNSMFTQNEISVYIWYVYLVLAALWAFVGSASITLAITKWIDSKKR